MEDSHSETEIPFLVLVFNLCCLHQVKKDSVVSCVLDSEAVAWDREKKQIQPFQVLTTRKRKVRIGREIRLKPE